MNFKIQIALILVIAFALIAESAAPNKGKNDPAKKPDSKGAKPDKKGAKPDTKAAKPGSKDGKTKAAEGDKTDDQTAESGECKDDDTNCKTHIGHCNEKSYTELLKKHCALSCGFCAPPAASCNDRSKKCEEWKGKGFCGSKTHAENTQRIYCAKTCDMCAK